MNHHSHRLSSQGKELPTTTLIKSLPKSKIGIYKHKRKRNEKRKISKHNLVDQIVYVAEKLNHHDMISEESHTQRIILKQQNEEFKKDLLKSNETNTDNEIFNKHNKNKTDANENIMKTSALKSCQDIIELYHERNYKIPDLDVKHNLFESNPLIQTEKEIKEFYTNKINHTGFIDNLDSFTEKNKDYLTKLQSLTSRLKEKKIKYKPMQEAKVKQSNTKCNLEQLPSGNSNVNKIDAKTNIKLAIENKALKDFISNTMQTIHMTTIEKINRKQTSPCLKGYLKEHIPYASNTITINTNANSNTINSPSVIPTPTNKPNANKSIPIAVQRKKTMDLINHRHLLKKEKNNIHSNLNSICNHNHKTRNRWLNDTMPIAERVRNKSRKEVINELYEMVQHTTFTNYLSSIKQYQKKYKRNKVEYNAPIDKTSKGFTKQLFNHFTHVKTIINNSNEKELCSSCYARIGKKDKVESKLQRLEQLDNQLTKFNYFFIKKKIINEKSN